MLDGLDESLGVGIHVGRERGHFYYLPPGAFYALVEFFCVQRIAVVNQISLVSEESVGTVRQIARDLGHPAAVGVGFYPGDFHAARGDVDEEQHHAADKSFGREQLYRKEVRGSHNVNV